MYEVGLAHAVRQADEMILVRSDHEEINFDIAGIKIHSYDTDDLAAARLLFASITNDRLKEIRRVKSFKVEQALAVLDFDCLQLVANYSREDFFSFAKPQTMSEVMENLASGRRDAVARLLELGIIRFDVTIPLDRWSYQWTDFGKVILERLQLRAKP